MPIARNEGIKMRLPLSAPSLKSGPVASELLRSKAFAPYSDGQLYGHAVMTDQTILNQYLELTDKLVASADKEQLAECARILAMNVAHYELGYGELPLDVTLTTTHIGKPNEYQVELLAKGMETMAGVLGNVMQWFGDKISH
jgi:hypothetical protein